MGIPQPKPAPPPPAPMRWQTRLRLFWLQQCRELQGYFSFPYSSVVSPALFTFVFTFGGFDQFRLAYLCSTLFFFWSMGFCLIRSPQLTTGKRLIACTFVAVLTVGAASWTFSRDRAEAARNETEAKNKLDEQLRARSGVLVPGNDPDVSNHCGLSGKPGYLVVAFGNDLGFVDTFPKAIISVGGENEIYLDRDDHGNMLFSADIWDQEHNILARIKNNKYTVDSSVFEFHRDDLSSLTVTIRKDAEQVLSVRYLNPHMIKIDGHFRSKSGSEVETHPELTIVDKSMFLHTPIPNCANGDTRPEDALFVYR